MFRLRLAVACPTSPDVLAVVNPAERRIGPSVQCSLLHGDHVDVARKHQRLQAFICTLDLNEQAKSVDGGDSCSGMIEDGTVSLE
jgi:hypothetical protein